MRAVSALHELQRGFLAALYDDREPGPLDAIAGNGLEPAARLRIYRRSCNENQTGALRTAFPAVRALVGEDFFDQTARGYRSAHPSRSGNLQAFGAHFADYLGSLPETRGLPYLPDVARLEWLRQEVALAADAESLSPDAFAQALIAIDGPLRIDLHPGVRLFASPHAVLTIWDYAMHPGEARLQLPEAGERVLLWREDGEVAMAALDAASFACVEALAQGRSLDDALAAACARKAGFDLAVCISGLVERGLLVALASLDCREEPGSCR